MSFKNEWIQGHRVAHSHCRNDFELECTPFVLVACASLGKVGDASARIVCIETFWNSDVRVLIKAGSTDRLAQSLGQACLADLLFISPMEAEG